MEPTASKSPGSLYSSRRSHWKPRAKSIFKELDLDDLVIHNLAVDNAMRLKIHMGNNACRNNFTSGTRIPKEDDSEHLASRPLIQSDPPTQRFSLLARLAFVALLIAVTFPAWKTEHGGKKLGVAEAGVIARANSPTDVCMRWAHQSARVNETIYIYGGEASTRKGQTTDTWNNNLITLDLTEGWDVSSPSLTGLAQPSGPPAVAMGALWNSKDRLWVYGGMFSDSPAESPVALSTWEYNIESAKWTDFADPKTSAGNYSDEENVAVQRAAEGASLSIPGLGRSYYFGGHLDLFTTEGWSTTTARVYIRSLLEFTHPGFNNDGVQSLVDAGAPTGGVYRNITQGGLQEKAGFTERADGVLAYIPGWGNRGIILGLAGGTNDTFTEMNVIDIFDIESSEWYKQSTTGTSPLIRVNPCATVFAAADGSSFNVYLYGGQNLIPAGEQIQYDDIWILTIPSFTWIKVDLDGQASPPARAGHTCESMSGQIIVIGGYNTTLTCDSPGVYVFDASLLQWSNTYTPTLSSSDSSDSVDAKDSTILQDSMGYQVPALVQSVIGGNGMGGATVTTPVTSPTGGPFQTGSAPQWTASGSTITATPDPKKASNTGAIAAGTVAGVLAIVAGYLAFCFWLHRRQLRMYQNHMRMTQRTVLDSSTDNNMGYLNDSESGTTGEKIGVTYGPFGTAIDGSASNSRPSQGGSTITDQTLTPSTPSESYSRGFGRFVPGAGPLYGKLNEHDAHTAYQGAGGGQMNMAQPKSNEGSVHTARSSTEDLLKGQEPSFFAVVLNPRRTLRVVNSD